MVEAYLHNELEVGAVLQRRRPIGRRRMSIIDIRTLLYFMPSAVLTNVRLVTSRKFLSRTTGFSHSSLLDTSPWVNNEGRLSKNRKSLTIPLPWALRSRVSRLWWSY